MTYTVRKVELPELRRRHLAHPDFADSGWAVVGLDGDEETFVDWYADKYRAVEEAAKLNNS